MGNKNCLPVYYIALSIAYSSTINDMNPSLYAYNEGFLSLEEALHTIICNIVTGYRRAIFIAHSVQYLSIPKLFLFALGKKVNSSTRGGVRRLATAD